MRYFRTLIKSSIDEIQKNAKVKFKDYDYDNLVSGFNHYLFSVIDKNLTFIAYEATEQGLECVFSMNERVYTADSAYAAICSILKNNFGITQISKCPVEISMIDFNEFCDEAHRHGNYRTSFRLARQAGNLVYDNDFFSRDKEGYRFTFDEATISDENSKKKYYLVDSTMSDELDRIKASKGVEMPVDAKIHYVVSTASFDVGRDITMRLMTELHNAGRLSGKRIELFSDINPVTFHKDGWVDKIIANSYDGVVVFDLSTRFGRDVSEYLKASEYIVKMVKKYHKTCTFVFTYNTSNPGFANYVLDELTSLITLVPVREGSGDKKAVSNHIKSMLAGTEYACYANDVNEFMSAYKCQNYSETEAFSMYDSFIRWVVKNKKLSMYSNCVLQDFRVNNTAEHESAIEELNNMIGLESVKKMIYRMMDTAVVNKKRQETTGKKCSDSMHMIFCGVPGTAKSTVAQLIGRIAKEKEILQSGVFINCNGSSINPEELHNAFVEAKGGVLFVDEAYAMGPFSLVTLLQEMEERRDEVIVILAGYEDAMNEFLSRNEGLRSRIPHTVKFPSYTTDELTDIFKFMLKQADLTTTDEAIEIASELFSKGRVKSNFGNGRYVREFLKDTKANQSSRLLKKYGDVDSIPVDELMHLTEDDMEIPNGVVKKGTKKGDALKEFEELIGLDTPKQMITNAIKRYKTQKVFKEKGIPTGNSSMHMVFTGNPGTAKTTVAQYFGRIMREEGLLSTGEFVAASKADLVFPKAGLSARLVRAKFEAAKGGILFIDEAYSLSDGTQFSDEAINTIIEEMENQREDTVVIFAGYPDEMKEFIERNPGMKSRIANYVDFADYTVDELIDITKLVIKEFGLKITDEAVSRLAPIFERARLTKGYGNGRYARKAAELARGNLQCRVADMGLESISMDDLTTILPEDIGTPAIDINLNGTKRHFGFAS